MEEVDSTERKELIMKNKNNLMDSHYYIENDLIPFEALIQEEIRGTAMR